MSEQASPVDQPEAPEPEIPAGEAPEETDWQKRFEDTQSAYTQGQQDLARIRQEKERHDQLIVGLQSTDPDVRAQAAQELGLAFEFVDDTPAENDDQMPYLTREEWQAYQQQQAQREQQTQAQAAQEAAIAQIDSTIQSHEGLNALDQADRDWVIAKALSIDPKMTPEGVPLPDIDTALQQFQGWDSGRWERARKSKRAPAIKAGGQAGIQAVPVDATHSQRVAAMVERLEAES
jgi:hypothetical protein